MEERGNFKPVLETIHSRDANPCTVLPRGDTAASLLPECFGPELWLVLLLVMIVLIPLDLQSIVARQFVPYFYDQGMILRLLELSD